MIKVSASEILKILDNQWADRSDVQKIGAVGINKAQLIMRSIREDMELKGYILPKQLVPMEKVIEYFKINISYLKKVSNDKNTHSTTNQSFRKGID